MGYMEEPGDMVSRKRVAIVGFSTVILVTMVVAVAVGVNKDKGHSYRTPIIAQEESATMKVIKSLCEPTDYKKQCLDTLCPKAGNTTDPIQLIKIGFNATMEIFLEAASKSNALQRLEKDPRTSKALDTCKELMELAVEDLKQAFNRVGDFDDLSRFNQMVMDLKVWLSATITYQESCLDAFENTTSTSNAAEQMKNALKISMRLSSNGLAMVAKTFASLSELKNPDPTIHRRRLLSFYDIPVHDHGDKDNGVGAPKMNKYDIVVAKDGSGSYKTITEALGQVPGYGSKTFVIYIKEGVYNESVEVSRSMTDVFMIGDGANKTRITGNKNFADGTNTYRTATVAIQADHFMAVDIGFENSAGPEKHQAVALRVSGDEAIFYRCSIDGYEGTLFTHVQRQFYRECTISGTVDFVFGDATAIFQNCTFLIRKPLPDQSCTVTAQGRKDKRQPSAIVIQNSTITGEPDYFPVKDVNKAYLGRPWKEYSRTIIMESYIDDVIQPEGWLAWSGDWGLRTCIYSEFGNRGPAADKSRRVTWHGIKIFNRKHAQRYTPGTLFKVDDWIRNSGVAYVPGLTTRGPKNATKT